MDGENNGKPYEQMDDLVVPPVFWKHPSFLTSPKQEEASKYCEFMQLQPL